MKIEIDLNQILGDESGVETLQESVRRQVVEKLSYEVRQNIAKKIDAEVAVCINESIKEGLKKHTPLLIEQILDGEYTPVDRWGDRNNGKTTTFRKELIRSVNESMVYQKQSYSSEESAFTKAVDGVVKANVDEFQKSFNKLVNDKFVEQTLDFAVNKLKEKLLL